MGYKLYHIREIQIKVARIARYSALKQFWTKISKRSLDFYPENTFVALVCQINYHSALQRWKFISDFRRPFFGHFGGHPMVKKFQKYFFWIERVILRRIEPIDDSNNFIPSHSQSKSRIFGENLILGIWGSKRGQIDLRPSQIDFSRNFEPDRLFISKMKISIRATFIWISL